MHIDKKLFITLSAICVYFDLFGTGSLLSSRHDRVVVDLFLVLGLLLYIQITMYNHVCTSL